MRVLFEHTFTKALSVLLVDIKMRDTI